MPEAKVESIDALRQFRIALLKFAERANVAISDAEGEVQRIMIWIETEQHTRWQSEVRKRGDIVTRCKEAVRQKKIFKDATGSRSSAVDEEKALKIALARFAEAEQKLANVKRHKSRLAKESLQFRSLVQPLASNVQVDIPAAASKLEQMSHALENYVALRAPEAPRDLDAHSGVEETAVRAAPASPDSSHYRSLRARTPTAEQRSAAIAQPLELHFGELGEDDQFRLATMVMDREPANAEMRVTIDSAATHAAQIYLHRTENDWHIGCAEENCANSQLHSMSIGELLYVRPDWRDMLTLPRGSLIVVARQSIVAILDERDENIG